MEDTIIDHINICLKKLIVQNIGVLHYRHIPNMSKFCGILITNKREYGNNKRECSSNTYPDKKYNVLDINNETNYYRIK